MELARASGKVEHGWGWIFAAGGAWCLPDCPHFWIVFFFGDPKKKRKRSHKSPNTPSWNTYIYIYKRKLYQQAISNGIPFIVGVGVSGDCCSPDVRGPIPGVAQVSFWEGQVVRAEIRSWLWSWVQKVPKIFWYFWGWKVVLESNIFFSFQKVISRKTNTFFSVNKYLGSIPPHKTKYQKVGNPLYLTLTGWGDVPPFLTAT